MENACQILFDTLTASPSTALTTLSVANSSRSNPFCVSEAIDLLPDKRQPELVGLVAAALAPPVAYFCNENPLVNREHEAALNLGTEIIRRLVLSRKNPPFTSLRQIIYDLHDVLLRLPSIPAQRTIADTCEWLWNCGDPQRERVIPQTLIFLLLKSFGDETLVVCDEKGAEELRRGTTKAIQRVFAIRHAFNVIAFGAHDSSAGSMTNLLLRCVTTSAYVKHPDGQKFIAFLLSIEDIRDNVLDTIVRQLASVRSSMASLYGHIILKAWKTNRADWLVDSLIHVAEKAIRAAHDPFGSNLRTVLSSFHLNKRLNGVDQLLHRIYSPTLFGNLMVANVRVRSNAVTILTEAFPIHDPGATREDIDNMVTSQCTKMLELLVDPAPSVRRATVEGVCRTLGMYWELVPSLSAKKMIDVITTKLAFDASSAIVRFACFEGLAFLMENHLAYPVLFVAMRELRPCINDASEKVRLGVVSLLLKVKEKRLPQLLYFDIIPIDDLVNRMSFERPAVAAKIMQLIVDSYFPLEKSGKAKQKMENVQIKPCLSLIYSSKSAASYFYRHLNLYVPPGPICNFAHRLYRLAHQQVLTRPRGSNTENEDPNVDLSRSNGPGSAEGESEQSKSECKEKLPPIVADLLASVRPSLQKAKNRALKDYVDRNFSSDSLLTDLSETDNPIRCRHAFWRIASCITPSCINPVIVYWREEMDNVVNWAWEVESDVEAYQELLSTMVLCAFRWDIFPTLLAVVSKWTDCASTGKSTPSIGLRPTKRRKVSKSAAGKGKRKAKGETSKQQKQGNKSSTLSARGRSLSALKALGTALAGEECDNELCREFELVLSTPKTGEGDQPDSQPSRLISCVRKGALDAMDHMFELSYDDLKSCLGEFVIALEAIGKGLEASLTFALFQEWQGILLDIRETMEWLASSDLWIKLSLVDSFFGWSLLGVCLGPIVDAVSLQRFDKRDLILLENISSHACANLKSQNLASVERVAIDLLRLAFHLDEQATYLDHREELETAPYRKETLRTTANSVLANVLELLSEVQTEEGQELGAAYVPSPLQQLVGRGLSFMSDVSDRSDLKKILGLPMVVQFGNEKKKESFLASTVSNAVRILATNVESGGHDKAVSTFRFVWESMRFTQDVSQGDLDEALLAFTEGVANSTIRFFEKRQAEKSPIPKEFFQVVESIFNDVFACRTKDSNNIDEISDVIDLMGTIQRLGDENVTAKPTNIDERDDAEVEG